MYASSPTALWPAPTPRPAPLPAHRWWGSPAARWRRHTSAHTPPTETCGPARRGQQTGRPAGSQIAVRGRGCGRLHRAMLHPTQTGPGWQCRGCGTVQAWLCAGCRQPFGQPGSGPCSGPCSAWAGGRADPHLGASSGLVVDRSLGETLHAAHIQAKEQLVLQWMQVRCQGGQVRHLPDTLPSGPEAKAPTAA